MAALSHNFDKNFALVVGAGISGATIAERLASAGRRVLVVDSKPHIGGNCHDYRDNNGICVHSYGTHIFHTNDKAVWDYLSAFTKWHPYMHKVLANIDGAEVPIPFNLNSLNQLFPRSLASRIEKRLLGKFGFGVRTTILELRESDDNLLKQLGEFVYEKVFLHYTLKQWGMKPEELDPAVTARVPIFVSRDNRYFRDKYQAIPRAGYSAMIGKMLGHENIEVRLNTPFSAIRNDIPAETPIFFSGSIDEFFDYELGELPYRSVSFEFAEYDREFFQSVACVNYPCNYDFTRIGEYKHFLGDKSPKTVVSFEFPSAFERGKNERCYPISSPENATLYARYLAKAEQDTPNVHFHGRLGDYRYYDMDKAVGRALALADEFLSQK
ncbi:MAG: UDP-galactopyranose mutase [Opitutae bacterium]|nr:UDP-galactopyranose mutase [Opitutae bacterium]